VVAVLRLAAERGRFVKNSDEEGSKDEEEEDEEEEDEEEEDAVEVHNHA